MKYLVKKLVPEGVKRFRKKIRDKRDKKHDMMKFKSLPMAQCDASSLEDIREVDLDVIFKNEVYDREWREIERVTEELEITVEAGGVNPGDRRALYCIVRALNPRNILEVGTHIGASTTHIALAMKRLMQEHSDSEYFLDTVDVLDVNDNKAQPWKGHGSRYSPKELMEKIGCAQHVKFHQSDSVTYLETTDQKYDFVFLDGGHEASVVYLDVPRALEKIHSNVHVLLHDYFPGLSPLWEDEWVCEGPVMAIERLKSEGAPIDVLPIGDLPWPTKLGSRRTSLAFLGRSVKSC